MELINKPEIPTVLYTLVGVLVFSNLSLIVYAFRLSFRAGIFVESVKLGIEKAMETGIRAHKRIDKLEDKVSNF